MSIVRNPFASYASLCFDVGGSPSLANRSRLDNGAQLEDMILYPYDCLSSDYGCEEDTPLRPCGRQLSKESSPRDVCPRCDSILSACEHVLTCFRCWLGATTFEDVVVCCIECYEGEDEPLDWALRRVAAAGRDTADMGDKLS